MARSDPSSTKVLTTNEVLCSTGGRAFEDNVALPAKGFVAGEPVLVIAFDYDGNERRGLVAKCRRWPPAARGGGCGCSNGSPLAARYVAAYRKWMRLVPYPQGIAFQASQS